jgi:hypothetical protein
MGRRIGNDVPVGNRAMVSLHPDVFNEPLEIRWRGDQRDLAGMSAAVIEEDHCSPDVANAPMVCRELYVPEFLSSGG